jgi:hypothetical protein
LVDPDKKVLAKTIAKIKENRVGPFTCKGVKNIREVLNDNTIDAVRSPRRCSQCIIKKHQPPWV